MLIAIVCTVFVTSLILLILSIANGRIKAVLFSLILLIISGILIYSISEDDKPKAINYVNLNIY